MVECLLLSRNTDGTIPCRLTETSHALRGVVGCNNLSNALDKYTEEIPHHVENGMCRDAALTSYVSGVETCWQTKQCSFFFLRKIRMISRNQKETSSRICNCCDPITSMEICRIARRTLESKPILVHNRDWNTNKLKISGEIISLTNFGRRPRPAGSMRWSGIIDRQW